MGLFLPKEMLSRCEHLGLSPGVIICSCPMLMGEEAVVCHIVVVQLTLKTAQKSF